MLDTSRIARRRTIALFFEEECARRKVKVIYKNVPDSDPVTDMLLRSILQAMDEWHSLTSKQKGLAGMAENVRQGWRAGGKAPRGYKLEYHATGAVRDGAPVTKSKLVLDDKMAETVQAYLKLRAQGISRGAAIARLQLPWTAASTHSMDWQALTYAGHTVWNMHAERGSEDKRRPRAEWLINRNTHPALIGNEEAEAILKQQEMALQGRRNRESPLLLTGLLAAPGGERWHSDGCGYYRLGKGKKIAAARIEQAVLARLAEDLASEDAVRRLRASMEALAGAPVDGRRIAGLERRIAALTTQIGRTVDLAAQLADPAPVMRRVQDLEHQRAQLTDELARLRTDQQQAVQAASITEDDVRALLRRLVAEISDSAGAPDRRAEARLALAEVIEKIELDPATMVARICYAIAGDNLASPRRSHLSPNARWASEPLPLKRSA